jgi:hypothetical protein
MALRAALSSSISTAQTADWFFAALVLFIALPRVIVESAKNELSLMKSSFIGSKTTESQFTGFVNPGTIVAPGGSFKPLPRACAQCIPDCCRPTETATKRGLEP